jgi:ATP-dependent Lon protease
MSLLGSVLPVGGLREKLLAASRSGMAEVIVPHRNAAEILRMPAEIRSRLKIHLVKDVQEVLGLSLVTAAANDASASAPSGEKKRAHHARGKARRKRKPTG